jgi:hypothetical protein
MEEEGRGIWKEGGLHRDLCGSADSSFEREERHCPKWVRLGIDWESQGCSLVSSSENQGQRHIRIREKASYHSIDGLKLPILIFL